MTVTRLALVAAVLESNVLAQTTKKKRRKKSSEADASGTVVETDTKGALLTSSAVRGPDLSPIIEKPIDYNPTRPSKEPEDEKPNPDEDENKPKPEPREDLGCRNNGKFFCRSKSPAETKGRRMTYLDAHNWANSKNNSLKRIYEYSKANSSYDVFFNRDKAKTADERAALRKKEDNVNRMVQRILAKKFNREEYDCEPDCVAQLPDWLMDPVLKPKPWYPWWPNPTPVEHPKCHDDVGEAWGLDRIDQPDKKLIEEPLDEKYERHCVCCGLKRTVVFVIDTGVQEHCEFGSRLLVSEGRSFDPEDGTSTPLSPPKQESGDTHGHGTHVAGTIGGCNVGVNQCTHIVGLRVFPKNSGSTWRSWIIAAIDYVTDKALNASGDDTLANFHKTINMSVGGGYSSAYDSAINDAYAAGVTVVVAAGNSGADACNYSPAHVTKAITVGATNSNDNIDWYSNWGKCVDIFAPGTAIYSAHENTGETAINMDESCEYTDMTGTSMASPHVAGVASLAHAYGLASTPGNTWQFIKCTAFNGKIANAGSFAGTVNRLLRKNLLENAYPCFKLAPFKPVPITKIPSH